VAEAGLPGFEATSWFALFAPAGTPRERVARLTAEVQRVYRLPESQEKLHQLGLDPVLGEPDELTRFQQAEIARWARLVRESGARADQVSVDRITTPASSWRASRARRASCTPRASSARQVLSA
jgi:hypothetical protein